MRNQLSIINYQLSKRVKNLRSLFLGLLLFCFLFSLFSFPVLAQSQISNPAITRVGDPPLESRPGGANSGLAQAANDLYSAYIDCTPVTDKANTTDSRDSAKEYVKRKCLEQVLRPKYPNTINGFVQTYESGRLLGSGCVECIGFVALAMSLVSGATDALPSGDPAAYINRSELTTGSLRFIRQSGLPQVGDIAITTTYPEALSVTVGHISVVGKLQKPELGGAKVFFGLESAFPEPPTCHANNAAPHPSEKYVFFRLAS